MNINEHQVISFAVRPTRKVRQLRQRRYHAMRAKHSLLQQLNRVQRRLAKRPEDGRSSSYDNFALDKAW